MARPTDRALQSAAIDVQRFLEWLAEQQYLAQRQVERRQEELWQAERDLTRCRNSGRYDDDGRYVAPSCSVEEDGVRRAGARLRLAIEHLETVKRCGQMVNERVAAYQRQAQRLAAALASDLPKATAFLGGKIDSLNAFLSVSVPSRSVSFGGGSSPSAPEEPRDREPGPSVGQTIDDTIRRVAEEVAEDLIERILKPERPPEERDRSSCQSPPDAALQSPWIDRGVQEVLLREIDVSDSHVHGAQDFSKVSAAEMRDGLVKLDTIVRPGVAAGHGPDYFNRLDVTRGLDYEHGYRRIYDAFYGSDAIRLEHVGDRYVVVNGYHRLFLARELGWSTIPARVIAPSP